MGVTYKKSGVNIDTANKFVENIKKIAPKIGGFSGLFPIDLKKYKNPQIVAATDGVGTKLKIANIAKKHDTVGIDLVAMNVNDIICCGAEPVLFLDYFATGKLKLSIAENVIKGIAEGCRQANCVLLGGETAEMPGFYSNDEYDLAGFAVGVVDKNKVIDGSRIKSGDVMIGLPSSGLHSNGFSLVRKTLSKAEQKKFAKVLLTPTKIYVREILAIVKKYPSIIKGMAHITGGGFYDNIIRVFPANTLGVIYKSRWQVPMIFRYIQQKGKIADKEIYRVLNMGIGMVLITTPADAKIVQKIIKNAIVIGEIFKGKKEIRVI
ncbi:MAG: phosphoribosylformylglycinamidine cyclo-ligase [Elusimicrobia bacterium]|nr:phosphoribosylformylglycinamidine cyclo-ligase [Elusimicrobiota bacterium]MBU2614090.1 phosphoribosylformylglycinamidine cyclo-ligase [Elusimicrobiota bacterium]